MKQLLYLTFLSLCAVACNKTATGSKSDITVQENKNLLIGTWESEQDGETVTLILNEDGTGTVVIPSKRTMNMLDPNYDGFQITWTHNGDNAYLKANGEDEVANMKILSLDNKSLVFQFVDKNGHMDDISYFIRKN